MAMMKGETHIAPIHLLDETTGIYNISYVDKYLKGKSVKLVEGIKRIQGFYVQKGNPKNIKNIDDLKRDDIIFVNRQKGAGTRILLDYQLAINDVRCNDVTGYNREMMTHMTVASAVKSGTADVGMGIESVARVMDLEFIPIAEESYDFIVTEEIYNSDLYKKFEAVITSEEFKERLIQMGGYRLDNIGQLIER